SIYADLCDDKNHRYFLDYIDVDEENEGLASITFFKVWKQDETQHQIETLLYYPLAMIADIFKPIDAHAQLLKNSDDECGFYFIPYAALGKLERHAMQWYSSHIDINWDKKSYLKNSKKGDYKYDYMRDSQKTQNHTYFSGPL
ncbi:MAG: hypothetical protein EZS28_056599, partial [Streblomastix strix]